METDLPEEMQTFLRYLHEDRRLAKVSVESYKFWLMQYWKWRVTAGYEDPLFYSADMVVEFQTHLARNNARKNSIK